MSDREQTVINRFDVFLSEQPETSPHEPDEFKAMYALDMFEKFVKQGGLALEITDEMAQRAWDAWFAYNEEHGADLDGMRAALDAAINGGSDA